MLLLIAPEGIEILILLTIGEETPLLIAPEGIEMLKIGLMTDASCFF